MDTLQVYKKCFVAQEQKLGQQHLNLCLKLNWEFPTGVVFCNFPKISICCTYLINFWKWKHSLKIKFYRNWLLEVVFSIAVIIYLRIYFVTSRREIYRTYLSEVSIEDFFFSKTLCVDFLMKMDSFDKDVRRVLRTCNLNNSFNGKRIFLYIQFIRQTFFESDLYWTN